ncbi:hypothetical protein [Kribbella italica]|uniref:Uncharacterized protein n=1 Tax=Kribbella italica TaxID=1540520 RepID=A0A7W9J9F6_9ACTN|nr:hypothetical protein [Kribbella italica]MBB5837759.1 hypothetical protein [Kribbella italica]
MSNNEPSLIDPGDWVLVRLRKSHFVYGYVERTEAHGFRVIVHRLSGRYLCEDPAEFVIPWANVAGHIAVVDPCGCDWVPDFPAGA